MSCKAQNHNWQLQLNQTDTACNCSTGQRQEERSQLSLRKQCRNQQWPSPALTHVRTHVGDDGATDAQQLQQEVWPPGSADTVCPRPPLMTEVQHFLSRIKKRQRCDIQTMWAYDLDLWPWCGFTSSICTPTLKFLGLTVRKIRHILCVCISRPVTLAFDLLISKLVCNVARVTGYLLPIFVILRLFVFDLWAIGTTRLRLITWPCDLDLWHWRSWRLWLMRVVVLHPYTKFEVRRPCRSEDMADDVCPVL